MKYSQSQKTLIWNGPMGAFELKPFDKGTIDTSICASKLTKMVN